MSEKARSVIAEAEEEFINDLIKRFDIVSDSDMAKLKKSAEFIIELLNKVFADE